MNYLLTSLALLLSLQATAQLSAGSNGITILSGTTIAIDGLTLTPSTNLSIANNSLSKTSTPLAGNPSINRVYQFSAPVLFSGTIGLFYLPTELNGYTESTLQLAYASTSGGPLTVTTASSVDATTHYVSKLLSNQTLLAVTATALPDLTPVLYARPSVVHGATAITVVVDVIELRSAPTNGLITVKLTKDPLAPLSFNGRLSLVGGRSVQNSVWNFDGLSDPAYYILTTHQSVVSLGTLSFGLEGSLNPGGTRGNLTLSSVLDGGSGGEVRVNNNTDADKMDYFQL